MSTKGWWRAVQAISAVAALAASGTAAAQGSCNTGGWPTNDACNCDTPWQSLNGPTCQTGQLCDRSSGWGNCVTLPSCNNGGWPTNDACLCDVPWQSQVPGNACQSGQVCSRPAGTCSGTASGGGGGPPPPPPGTPSCNTGGWPTNDPCVCDVPWQSLNGYVCDTGQVCSRPDGTCSGTSTGGGGGGGGFTGDGSTQPAFGAMVWGFDPAAVIRAGFGWFEVGYPFAFRSSQYQALTDAGIRTFAYINMSEIPKNDPDLQAQINNALGFDWSALPSMGDNPDWPTKVIDVRSADWQRWLLWRVDQAYGFGLRGVKWDVADMEDLYLHHWGDASTRAQVTDEAIQQMGALMVEVNRRHPDMKQIVNQGYAIAERFPQVVAGFEVEDMVQHHYWTGDSWFYQQQQRWDALHASHGIPVIMAEFADPASGTAASLAQTIEGWGLTPYVTDFEWRYEGRGIWGRVPPW